MRIGTLARQANVSVDTIRLYEARGMIRADRRANGYRDFPEETAALVRLIRQGLALGFSLSEIKQLLLDLGSGLSTQEVADLLDTRIAAVDERIAGLTALRDMIIQRRASACPLMSPKGRSGRGGLVRAT